MSDNDLLGKLAKVSVTSGRAAMAYAALCDDQWFAAISELRRRYRIRETEKAMTVQETSYSPSGRLTLATSVRIDAARWRLFWNQRRVTLVDVSRSINRSGAWSSVVANKGRVSIRALDELSVAWSIPLDELIHAVATDAERERQSYSF